MILSLVTVLLCICSSIGEFQPQIQLVTGPVIHGEGPHWDRDREVLYYVDITNQTINKYDPKTKQSHKAYIEGGPISLVIPVRFEDEFVVGRGRDIVLVRWDGEDSMATITKVLNTVDKGKDGNRFNDGKADSSGRLWAGTMGPENPDILLHQGSLYSFDPFNNFRPVMQLTPVSISNGLAWNKDDTKMYYIDSPTRNIDVFDFDIIHGTIENRRTLFSFDNHNLTGVPDGMTIDESDNLWVAVYNGNSILHIDTRNGTLLHKIDFPVKKITSCTFGGPGLEALFVTTSRRGLNESQLEKEPGAGSVFEVSGIGVKGQIKPNKIQIISSSDSEQF